MKRPIILLADKHQTVTRKVRESLLREGYEVTEADDKTSIFGRIQERRPDLVIVGSSQEGARDGLELTHQIREWDRRMPIILVTANSTDELIVTALRAGVKDYLRLPFSFEDLVVSVRRCLHGFRVSHPPRSRPNTLASGNGNLMIGEGASIREIKAFIAKVASTDSNVLITGETGTGKELVAQLIHMSSRRCRNPIVSINCAAIPDDLLESELFGYERGAFTGAHSANEGKLKLAEGGTVFFDEIGDMSPWTQAKILRAIEIRRVDRLGGRESVSLDIRIIAATNQDLEAGLAEGKMRKDLYYRLSVARIHLPPLRERKEDIPALLQHYVRDMNYLFRCEVEGFTDEAVEALLRYDWPGNIRELRNLLEAIFISSPSRMISVHDLPERYRNGAKVGPSVSTREVDRLLSALCATNWNKSMAAEKLHWSRMTLYRKMAKYKLATSGKQIDRKA